MNERVKDSTLDGPRPARSEERDDLIDMVNLIFRISAGREPTIASDWPHVYAPANLENVMVVSDRSIGERGKMVASTGVWACETRVGHAMLRVGGINCVGTLPEYRRHGLGFQVMEAAQAKMRDLGCHVGLLVTGIMNWYRRLGWEEAGGVRSYRFNRGNIALLPALSTGIRWRFAGAGEDEVAAAIVRLRNQDRLGAMRTVEGFRQLYAARRSPQILLAESEGAAIAYLLARDNFVMEWGGDARGVAGLVRSYFEKIDDPAASTSQRNEAGRPSALQYLTLLTPALTPAWQHPLVTLLDAVCIPYATEYLGMIYVVDPQPILDAYGISSVEVEAVGDEFRLHAKGESVKLTRNQLAKFLFGPERISKVAADNFPLPFWQWILEKV